MSDNPLFELTNVQFKDLLHIESLSVPDKKISCIVGPSGGGKTTLLKLLNHLISPDNGTILFKGNDLTTVDPIALRREVVMLQQNPVTFDGDIRYNLVLGCTLSDRPIPSDPELLTVLRQVKLSKQLSDDAGETFRGRETASGIGTGTPHATSRTLA